MEKAISNVLEGVLSNPSVSGCIVSDKQGLCLGCSGTISSKSSGLLKAISDLAKKLGSDEIGPIITLENEEKQCMIQSNDTLVVSIFKTLSF